MSRLALLLIFAAHAAAALATPVAVPELRALPRTHVPSATVASNGRTSLAAWIDDRAPASIRATRIGSDGVAVDRQGIRVADSAKSFGIVATAWNGKEFVIFAPGDDTIVAARVGEDGRVLEAANPIREPGVFIADSAAWNGSHYMLVARTAASDRSIVVKLLVLDAAFSVTREVVLDPNPSAFVGGCGVASDDSGFAVVWERLSGGISSMFIDRYDAGGQPLPRQEVTAGSGPAATSFSMRWPAISWNGSTYTVVWTSGGVFGLAMSAQGALGEPFRISADNGVFASIGWNGAQHLVTWTAGAGQFRLVAARMTPGGSVLDTRTVGTTTAGQSQAGISSADGTFAMVWFTSIFGLDGAHQPLAADYAPQSDPKIAGDAAGLFAAWSEAGVIYGSRLAGDGTPLDGSGIALSDPERAVAPTALRVVTNGNLFLVVWSSSPGGLACARISSDGAVLDPGGVALTASDASFVAATDGRDFMIAMSGGHEVSALRIPAAGPVRAEFRPILPSMLQQFPLALVWNGSGYSLLWSEITESHCGVFTCTSVSTRRMTVLTNDAEALATREVPLTGGVVGLGRTGDELLYVASDGGFFTQRVAVDGAVISAKVRVGNTASTVPAILIRTPEGFSVVAGFSRPAEAGRCTVAVIDLDAEGEWVTTRLAAIPSDSALSDAVGTGSAVVVAYTAPSDLGDSLRRAFTTRIRPTVSRRFAAGH